MCTALPRGHAGCSLPTQRSVCPSDTSLPGAQPVAHLSTPHPHQTWTDNNGVPDDAVTKDEMLTNICIYWFTGRITSSMRLYKETLANQ